MQINGARNIDNENTQGKNENAQRWFLLPSIALEVLADQSEMLKNKGIISPWLFPGIEGLQGEHQDSYNEWDRYRTYHDMRCSLYELRHTMISLISPEMPEKYLKEIVGHSMTMDTFGTYSHKVDGEMEKARDIMQSVFAKLLKS